MKTKLSLNEKDFITLELLAYASGIFKITGFVFAVALAALGIWLFAAKGGGFGLMVFSLAPAAIYIYSIFSIIPKNAAQAFNRSSYAGYAPEFEINETSITIVRSGENVSEIKLSNLKSVMETRKYFYFFISKNNTIILPKRLISAQDSAYVHKIVKSLPKNQRKNPHKIPLGKFIFTMFAAIFIIFCVIMIMWSYSGNF